MEYDEDKVDEMLLALLFVTTVEESPHGTRAWKGHDWNVLDRLHRKGYISDPRSKPKSVVVTEEGVKQSRALFAKYFRKKITDGEQSVLRQYSKPPATMPSLIHSD